MSVSEWLPTADRNSPWREARVLVTGGLGVAGFACADGLLQFGAQVVVVDDADTEAAREKAKLLRFLDAEVIHGPGSSATLPEGIDLVVTSPGWRPTQPILAAAAEQGIPIWGDVELAWRLQQPDHVVPWLGITGTNGKTTTTQMLASMLAANGYTTDAVGNIGRPVMEAVLDEVNYDVLAVELSSFQLHWTHSLALHSAAVLNVHEDHLEWYPDYAAYAADKAKIYERVTHACVYNHADPQTETMVENAEVTEGARAIGFTLGIPSPSMVGVVEDMIVDRAFIAQRKDSALPLCDITDVQPFAPHNVENALAAAALARSFGVEPHAVRDGLRTLHLGGHRIETVAEIDGVTYVDDSKATNPHAANSSLRAYDPIVWIAGGQAKGTTFDELVAVNAARLRGAVLLGVDRDVVARALAQHAPDVPVVVIDGSDTGAMARAVEAAQALAQPGDTVLLAPGCASKDMWSGYDARGDDFAAAVRALETKGE